MTAAGLAFDLGMAVAVGTASVRMSHALVRDVAYAEIGVQRRASLHRRAAEHSAARFGDLPHEFEHHVGDVTVLDKTALVVLCATMIILGLYPAIMAPLIETAVRPVMALFGVQ